MPLVPDTSDSGTDPDELNDSLDTLWSAGISSRTMTPPDGPGVGSLSSGVGVALGAVDVAAVAVAGAAVAVAGAALVMNLQA